MDHTGVVAIPLPDTGERFVRLLSGRPQTQGVKSGYITLKPGESVGLHSTHEREEVIVVLAGTVAVVCAQAEPLSVSAPGLIYIPAQTQHDMKNVGKDIVRYVYIVSAARDVPGGHTHEEG